jgi:hypothetical protein
MRLPARFCGRILVPSLHFSSEEHGRAIRVRVSERRVFLLAPGEFRDCLLRAEKQLRSRSPELLLSVPGKMRLRLTGCPRSELEMAVRIMHDVLEECSEASTAFAALN